MNQNPQTEPRFFFIRGFMRSGTNWISNLLNLHPRVFSSGEFHFEAAYDPFLRLVAVPPEPAWRTRLSKVRELALQRFEDLVKSCIKASALAEGRQDAAWLGDRTPSLLTLSNVSMIRGARYFWCYRDGRDVLVSLFYHRYRNSAKGIELFKDSPRMRSRSRSFLENPAFFKKHPHKLFEDEQVFRASLRRWVKNIKEGLLLLDQEKENALPVKLCVIQYESLHRDIEGERARIYRFLDLDPSLARPLDTGFVRTSPGFPEENFLSHYRSGKTGDWRNYFTRKTCRWFKEETKDLLVRLGYEESPNWKI